MRVIPEDQSVETFFSKVVKWILLLGAILFIVIWFGFILISIVTKQNWIMSIITNHMTVMLSLPIAGVTSLIIVLFLGTVSGEIKFKILGMDFKGASGPIVMWVLCYLAIILSLKLMW
ncbi:MAG: hypothetical protein QQN41_14195, partial [Nitrosopumilus sp.]